MMLIAQHNSQDFFERILTLRCHHLRTWCLGDLKMSRDQVETVAPRNRPAKGAIIPPVNKITASASPSPSSTPATSPYCPTWQLAWLLGRSLITACAG